MRPEGPDGSARGDILAIARRDCLMWAIRQGDILEAFRRDTGNRWTPGLTPIDRLIDQETGAEAAFAEAFVRWFDENIWGDLC